MNYNHHLVLLFLTRAEGSQKTGTVDLLNYIHTLCEAPAAPAFQCWFYKGTSAPGTLYVEPGKHLQAPHQQLVTTRPGRWNLWWRRCQTLSKELRAEAERKVQKVHSQNRNWASSFFLTTYEQLTDVKVWQDTKYE